MKHPQINEHKQTSLGNQNPWSLEREYRLRRRIKYIWIALWVFALGGLFLFSLASLVHIPVLTAFAGMSWGAALFLLVTLAEEREKLGEEMRCGPGGQFFEGSGMLANKPRSTHNLTQWLQHPVSEPAFFCPCRSFPGSPGKMPILHTWAEAKWIPNYDPDLMEDFDNGLPRSDPGGGRYVILCSCGVGHFKLKPLTEQDIVDGAAKKGH